MKQNNDILSAKSFLHLYGGTHNLVYVNHAHKHKYVLKIGNAIYVEVGKLKKRRDFYEKVWNRSIDNYYALCSLLEKKDLIDLLSNKMGGSKQSWREFVNYDLFSTHFRERNLLSYKINKKLWKFYRFSQHYARRNKC